MVNHNKVGLVKFSRWFENSLVPHAVRYFSPVTVNNIPITMVYIQGSNNYSQTTYCRITDLLSTAGGVI